MKAAPADSRDGFQNASQKLLSFERDLPEIAIQDDLSVFHLVLPQCGQLKPRTLIFQYFWAYILHFFTKTS